MPRLNKQQASSVSSAEAWGSFAPVEAGIYAGRLSQVEVKQGNEGPYWSWEYHLLDAGRNIRVWDNTSLSDKAYGKFKAVFDAYGVDSSTDTDELIATILAIRVGVRTIQKGNRKGELTNSIEELMPIESHPDFGKPGFLEDSREPASAGAGRRNSSAGREIEEDPF